MKVILDTNFLVYCAKQKIDYIGEIGNLLNEDCELAVPSVVVEELEKLRGGGIALQILEKNIDENRVKVLETSGNADEVIKNLAGKGVIIATMDRELKNQLKNKGRILSIRQKKKLEIL